MALLTAACHETHRQSPNILIHDSLPDYTQQPIGTYFIVFRTRRMSPYERMILPDFQGERNISAFRKK